jgi:hypothetical protein
MANVSIWKSFRVLLTAVLLLGRAVSAQSAGAAVDSDRDGLPDQLEDALLARFVPTFMVSKDDCSVAPASFAPGLAVPTVVADDGTIYGQATPRQGHPGEVELHFYHLWRKDCGEMGHHLDTEHVAVLLTGGNASDVGAWRAQDWYAAAHEDTICDASQITRAATITAEHEGATVWISTGKHASYLSEDLCTHGCGGDRCPAMRPLPRTQPVNLGEANAPMNGAVWIASKEWPLSIKLSRSDFTEERLSRLERLPVSDVAWVNPGKRPAQAAILGVNAGAGGAATGMRSTDTALVIAHDRTGAALDTSATHTGNALGKSLRSVGKALGTATRKTTEALGGKSHDKADHPQP